MTKAQKLRACWNHIRTSYGERNPRIPHSHGAGWAELYANDIFVSGAGNCFSYGAAFAYMAKAVGYSKCYACNSGGHASGACTTLTTPITACPTTSPATSNTRARSPAANGGCTSPSVKTYIIRYPRAAGFSCRLLFIYKIFLFYPLGYSIMIMYIMNLFYRLRNREYRRFL